jgi:hypothetical protein
VLDYTNGGALTPALKSTTPNMIPLAVGLGIYADIEAATALNANTLKIELLRLCGKVDSITIDDKTMPPTVKVNHFIKQSFAEPAQVPQA